MLDRIKQFLAVPVFEDEETARIARLLHTTLLILTAVLAPFVVFLLVLMGIPTTLADAFTPLSTIGLLGIILLMFFLLRRGQVRTTGSILSSVMWLIITAWIYLFGSISTDKSIIVYPLIIVYAGLISGTRAAIAFTLLCAAAVLGGYYLDFVRGVIPSPVPSDTIFQMAMILMSIGLVGILLRHAVGSTSKAFEQARRNERTQREANQKLEEVSSSLEQRVAERTEDAERRAQQLQAVVDVSQAAASILDPETLMWEVSQLIQERFDMYHVGLFLLDATGVWVEYRAGSGQIGRQLAAQQFRLDVVGGSMIGWCTIHTELRVSQDARLESARQDHPLLPETQSEAAIPLVARGQVIGAMSVQSDQTDAFGPHTLAALQTIADHVALAIDNARLFAESQQALETAQRAYGEMSRQTWGTRLSGRTDWGYVYSHQTIAPLGDEWRPGMLEAHQRGVNVQESDGKEPSLAVPLRVRDQVIGALSFTKPARDREWTTEEMSLLQTLVDQLGVALESAQLFEETQRRAARDRLLGEITARIRETLDMDTVLQTAVREIGEALGIAEVEVRLAEPTPVQAPASPAGGGNGSEGGAV